MDPLTTEEVTALVKRAHDTISDLCHQRKRWVMSIPARPDEDPDLIISAALRAQTDAIRDRERERDVLTEEYHANRAALRDALSEVENTCYPTNKEKIAFLRDQKYKLPIVERERDDKEYARKEWAETAHRVIMERDELQRKLSELQKRADKWVDPYPND